MGKLYAKILWAFSDYKKVFRKERGVLLDFQFELRKFYFMTNEVEGIVKLFKLLYPFYRDKRLGSFISELEKRNDGRLDELIITLKKMDQIINEAWSSDMNQTLPRKKPNKYTIYLIGHKGFKRRPVAYFLKKSEELKKETCNNSNTWDILNNKCGEFVNDVAEKLLKEIEIIEEKWL